MKSIISRYGEMKVGATVDAEGEALDYNKVDTALASVGISIKDAQGQFRDFDDVIFELSEKWDSLDKNTQRYIATIMAGNRQQSRFIALVDNWERLDEVANAAKDSEDAGLLQYAKTLDSLETKISNLKTSFQQLYMSVLDGDAFKGFLETITNILTSLGKVDILTMAANILTLINNIKTLGNIGIGFASGIMGGTRKDRAAQWTALGRQGGDALHGWVTGKKKPKEGTTTTAPTTTAPTSTTPTSTTPTSTTPTSTTQNPPTANGPKDTTAGVIQAPGAIINAPNSNQSGQPVNNGTPPVGISLPAQSSPTFAEAKEAIIGDQKAKEKEASDFLGEYLSQKKLSGNLYKETRFIKNNILDVEDPRIISPELLKPRIDALENLRSTEKLAGKDTSDISAIITRLQELAAAAAQAEEALDAIAAEEKNLDLAAEAAFDEALEGAEGTDKATGTQPPNQPPAQPQLPKQTSNQPTTTQSTSQPLDQRQTLPNQPPQQQLSPQQPQTTTSPIPAQPQVTKEVTENKWVDPSQNLANLAAAADKAAAALNKIGGEGKEQTSSLEGMEGEESQETRDKNKPQGQTGSDASSKDQGSPTRKEAVEQQRQKKAEKQAEKEQQRQEKQAKAEQRARDKQARKEQRAQDKQAKKEQREQQRQQRQKAKQAQGGQGSGNWYSRMTGSIGGQIAGDVAMGIGTALTTAAMGMDQSKLESYDASTAMQGFGAAASAFGQFISGNPIEAVVTAIGGLATVIQRVGKRDEVRLQELENNVKDAEVKKAQAKDEERTLEEMINKVKTLEETKNLSDEDYQAWLDANNQLAEAYPELISYMEGLNYAIVDTEAASLLLAEKMEMAASAAQDFYDAKIAQLKGQIELGVAYGTEGEFRRELGGESLTGTRQEHWNRAVSGITDLELGWSEDSLIRALLGDGINIEEDSPLYEYFEYLQGVELVIGVPMTDSSGNKYYNFAADSNEPRQAAFLSQKKNAALVQDYERIKQTESLAYALERDVPALAENITGLSALLSTGKLQSGSNLFSISSDSQIIEYFDAFYRAVPLYQEAINGLYGDLKYFGFEELKAYLAPMKAGLRGPAIQGYEIYQASVLAFWEEQQKAARLRYAELLLESPQTYLEVGSIYREAALPALEGLAKQKVAISKMTEGSIARTRGEDALELSTNAVEELISNYGDKEWSKELQLALTTDIGSKDWYKNLVFLIRKYNIDEDTLTALGIAPSELLKVVYENFTVASQAAIDEIDTTIESAKGLIEKHTAGFTYDEAQALYKQIQAVDPTATWDSVFRRTEEGLLVLVDLNKEIERLYEEPLKTLQEGRRALEAMQGEIGGVSFESLIDATTGEPIQNARDIFFDSFSDLIPDTLIEDAWTLITEGQIKNLRDLQDWLAERLEETKNAEAYLNGATNRTINEANLVTATEGLLDRGQIEGIGTVEGMGALINTYSDEEVDWDTILTILKNHGIATMDAFGNLIVTNASAYADYLIRNMGIDPDSSQAKAITSMAQETYRSSITTVAEYIAAGIEGSLSALDFQALQSLGIEVSGFSFGADGIEFDTQGALEAISGMTETFGATFETAEALAAMLGGKGVLGSYFEIEDLITQIDNGTFAWLQGNEDVLSVLRQMYGIYSQMANDSAFDFMNAEVLDGKAENFFVFAENVETATTMLQRALAGEKIDVRQFIQLTNWMKSIDPKSFSLLFGGGEDNLAEAEAAVAQIITMADALGQLDLKAAMGALSIGLDGLTSTFEGGVHELADQQLDYWTQYRDFLKGLKALEEVGEIKGINFNSFFDSSGDPVTITPDILVGEINFEDTTISEPAKREAAAALLQLFSQAGLGTVEIDETTGAILSFQLADGVTKEALENFYGQVALALEQGWSVEDILTVIQKKVENDGTVTYWLDLSGLEVKARETATVTLEEVSINNDPNNASSIKDAITTDLANQGIQEAASVTAVTLKPADGVTVDTTALAGIAGITQEGEVYTYTDGNNTYSINATTGLVTITPKEGTVVDLSSIDEEILKAINSETEEPYTITYTYSIDLEPDGNSDNNGAVVPESETITITADTDPATRAITALRRLIDSIDGASITVAVNYSESTGGSSAAAARGNVSGLALANGNALLDYGARLAGKTLVGELGPELAVYDNKYHLLGANGAEFVNLPSDAIVFNNRQTEGIINGQAGYRGKALVNGNVEGDAFAGGGGLDAAIAAVDQIIALWQSMKTSSVSDLVNAGSGGGGGGGGNLKAVTAELQEWYNLTRQIANLEQEISNLEAKRNNLGYDGSAYLKNLRETQVLLERQKKTQEVLLRYQALQLKRQADFINSNEYWNKFLYVDEDGLLQYRKGNETDGGKGALDVLTELNKMSAKEQEAYLKSINYSYTDQDGNKLEGQELVQKFFEEIQNQIDAYDSLYDTVNETEQQLQELTSDINAIDEEILENTKELEQDIYDIIVEGLEKQIEEMTEQAELLKEANEKYINGLENALNKEKDQYSQQQDVAEREALQRRLALLRRSGGSASEIADLEKQLDETLKNEYFTNQENTIKDIQEASEKQNEYLERQIKLQEDALEFQKENGLLWTRVYEIMSGTKEDILAFMSGNKPGFFEQSRLQQETALLEWSKKIGIFDEDKKYNEYLDVATSVWDSGNLFEGSLSDLSETDLGKMRDLYGREYAQARLEGLSDSEAHERAKEQVDKSIETIREQAAAETAAPEEDKEETSQESGEDGYYVSTYEYTINDGEPQTGSGSGATPEQAEANAWYWANKKVSESNAEITRDPGKPVFHKRYKTGGLVDYTGLAMVDGSKKKPEAFLNAAQTAKITESLKLAGKESVLENILTAIGSLNRTVTSSMEQIINNFNKNNETSITIESGAVSIQVAQINDAYDIEDLSNDIMDRMVSIASKTVNRGVTRR